MHDGEAFAQRLREWKRTAAHPDLLKGMYVLENADREHSRLLLLNASTGRFETAEWPEELQRFRAPLQALSADLAAHPPLVEHLRQRAEGTASKRDTQHNPDMGGMREQRNGGRDHGGPGMFMRRGPRGGPWTVDLVTPALLHLEINRGTTANAVPKVAWIILDLDPGLLQDHILPELAQRYFGGPQGLTYDLAIVGNDDRSQVLYTSSTQMVSKAATPDAVMPLFGPIGGPVFIGSNSGAGQAGGLQSGATPQPGAAPQSGAPNDGTGTHRHEPGAVGPVRLDPLPLRAQGGDWRLIVKHRKGSLEAAVASLYRRNLAISFGILLVLAATMTMIVITARRAQRLARLQMDFVTGVSHELRTPLAVINSAAENIADGIVDNKQRLMRYGTVIRKQVRQLSQLVEQILLFAATNNGEHQFSLKVVDAREVVDLALANTEELTQSAAFEVERQIDEGVPQIRADLMALSQCVQNLITNAVKYSGDARWIGVRASAGDKSDGSKEVRISVTDHGLGISNHELHRIFDPFYRSPAATAAQIHGTGLGLSLAKKIAEGMCGYITVESEPGQGSCFTLHLPAVSEAERHLEAEPAAISHGSVQA
jgi:signal transduction histidine kinase